MSKTTNKIVAVFAAITVVCLFLGGCLFGNTGGNSEKEPVMYSVYVKTEGGMPLKDIDISVYADSNMDDLVWKGTSDKEGKLSFEAKPSDEYIAVLEGVPDGYELNEYYTINDTEFSIDLKSKLLDADEMYSTQYKLGSIVNDFTVADFDGNEYTVSELLKTKRAVVLNFWFINCGPCKMEFPYLQSSYEDFSDEIALIALNPTGDSNESIAEFANDFNLTFPMGECDFAWQEMLGINAYPTTVVIDRYGMISMIHKGYITEKETFDSIFKYYSDDNYTQSIVRNMSDIIGEEGE